LEKTAKTILPKSSALPYLQRINKGNGRKNSKEKSVVSINPLLNISISI
jgi:hypothetical protein